MGTPVKVVLPEMRLSYTHLFEPRAIKAGDEAKYSTAVLIPKSDTKTIKAINDAVSKVIEQNQDTLKTKKGLKHPLRDGDTESDDPAYAGHYFLSANSKTQPAVVDLNRQEIIDPRQVYSGVYGRVSVNFYAFNVTSNKGVAVGLNAVQITKDGEPLGSTYTKADLESDFGDDVDNDNDLNGGGADDDGDDLM